MPSTPRAIGSSGPIGAGAVQRSRQTPPMAWTPDPDALRGRVAVVAGATRAPAAGIAAALGEAGATVVLHRAQQPDRARSAPTTTGPRRSRRPPSWSRRSAATGVAVAVDHLDPDAGARRWPAGSAPSTATSTCWSTTSGAARCSRAARASGTRRSGSSTSTTACGSCGWRSTRTSITSHHLLPLLVDRPGGLRGRGHRRHHRLQRVALPDLGVLRPGQGAVNRLAFSQGHELARARRHRGRDHARLAALGDDARRVRCARGELARRFTGPPDFAVSESPRYVGRAVAALAADAERARWNQQSVTRASCAEGTASPTSTARSPTSGATSPTPRRATADPQTPTAGPRLRRTQGEDVGGLTDSGPCSSSDLTTSPGRRAGGDGHERPRLPDCTRPARSGRPTSLRTSRGRSHHLTLRYACI